MRADRNISSFVIILRAILPFENLRDVKVNGTIHGATRLFQAHCANDNRLRPRVSMSIHVIGRAKIKAEKTCDSQYTYIFKAYYWCLHIIVVIYVARFERKETIQIFYKSSIILRNAISFS